MFLLNMMHLVVFLGIVSMRSFVTFVIIFLS